MGNPERRRNQLIVPATYFIFPSGLPRPASTLDLLLSALPFDLSPSWLININKQPYTSFFVSFLFLEYMDDACIQLSLEGKPALPGEGQDDFSQQTRQSRPESHAH